MPQMISLSVATDSSCILMRDLQNEIRALEGSKLHDLKEKRTIRGVSFAQYLK